MQVTVRFTDLTPEQQAFEDRTIEAAKLLRENGFPCTVDRWMCFKPTDTPCTITLKEP